jgi:hypothetical protein
MNRFAALIAVLVVATIALGLCLSTADRNADKRLIYSFLGLLFGDAALVSTWAGLSSASIARRFTGLFVAGTFLWAIVMTAAGIWRDVEEGIRFAVVVAACVLPVTVAFMTLKHTGPRLLIRNAADLPRAHQPLQFSTRHLFILALLVALGSGRLVRGMGRTTFWLEIAIISAVIAGSVLYTTLAAVWACLSANQVAWRALVAFAVALLAGLIPAYYFRAPSISE